MTGMMLRALLAAALVLLAACAARPHHAAPLQEADPADRAVEARASRNALRPLQPPAAPDTRSPATSRPAPQRVVRSPARAVQPTPAQWARLRQCESGGNYQANTGNGYYGAFQADVGTWARFGGYRVASDAPPSVQDQWAAALYARRGTSPWPQCGRWLR